MVFLNLVSRRPFKAVNALIGNPCQIYIGGGKLVIQLLNASGKKVRFFGDVKELIQLRLNVLKITFGWIRIISKS